MVGYLVRWPWHTEIRESFTDQAVAALVDHAVYGTTQISPGDTAPVLGAAVEWSSAACRLSIDPEVSALTGHLAQIGSDLVRLGRWAALIALGEDGVVLAPCTVEATPPRQPGYVVIMIGATRRVVSRDQVLMFSCPVPAAGGASGRVLAALLHSAQLESHKPVGVIAGLDSTRADGVSASSALAASWSQRPSAAAGFSGVSDGRPATAHLGRTPQSGQDAAFLHVELSRSIALAYGVTTPGGGGEAGVREAARATDSRIAPLLEAIIGDELRQQLNPAITITSTRRSASDWASLARAVGSLVAAGVPVEDATHMVNLFLD